MKFTINGGFLVLLFFISAVIDWSWWLVFLPLYPIFFVWFFLLFFGGLILGSALGSALWVAIKKRRPADPVAEGVKRYLHRDKDGTFTVRNDCRNRDDRSS